MITKEAICSAALKLAAKKDIDKITIKEIADECHITRQAFYYHFQDMIDMVEWAAQREIDRLAEKGKDCRSPEEILLLYYNNFIVDKRTFIYKALNSSYYAQAAKRLKESLKEYLLKQMYYSQNDYHGSIREGDFLLDYHTWAIIAVFVKWSREKDTDPEEGIRQIVRIIKGNLHF